MEERKKVDRLSIIKNLILVAFVVILVKILYMTTFKYEHYTELAENKTYKQLLIKMQEYLKPIIYKGEEELKKK